MCHESKIPTRIEMFAYVPLVPLEVIPPEKLQSLRFKRIGHVSFDSNERTNYTARELKSVYVDFFAHLLKLQVHKCYTSKQNVFKQVGVLSVKCVASNQRLAVKAPDAMTAKPEVGPAVGPPVGPPADPPAGATEASAEAPKEQPSEQARTIVQTEERLDAPVDVGTLQELRVLEREKARAVDLEDFDEALRLKNVILKLKAVSKQLAELEHKKREAVKCEDYEAAKRFKVEVEKLKASILAQEAPTKLRASRATK